MTRVQTWWLGLLLAVASLAQADPPVPFAPGTDLDGNGVFETEYSRVWQEFTAPASGGRITFDWQLFSTEGIFGGGAEDVFYARLIDVGADAVLEEVNGALDVTPGGYSGLFTPIGAPPMGTTAPSLAPAGGTGLMFEAQHAVGGSGWTTGSLSIDAAAQDRLLRLEFLVADTFDPNADTSLGVDDVRVLDVLGAPVASFTNGGFESGFGGWTVEGNTGIYSSLEDLFSGVFVVGTAPPEGRSYALLSTAGVVPEPEALLLLLTGSTTLLLRRVEPPSREPAPRRGFLVWRGGAD